MSVLVGGVAGASARIGGGLSSIAMSVADVRPTDMQKIRPSLGMKDSIGLSRFRKHLNGLTTDLLNLPLAAVTVKIFANGTDLLVGSLVSDAVGNYDLPVYQDGSFYAWIYKAGSPNVFGGSDILTPG